MAEATNEAFGRTVREDWPLDFSWAFLNHGSFGSVPKEVAEVANTWRARFEAHPVEWFWRKGPTAVRAAAVEVAEFLGADPSCSGFVVNATAAVNAVLRDLELEAGDELLVLDQGYGAVKQAALHRAAHNGAVVRECSIPLPCRKGPDAIVGALDQAITPRTRLAILDQITSPSALLLPMEAMIRVCNERSVPVLVDGAHAPGMLDKPAKLDGATWWTGNLHKWLGAPKGCAVLSMQASTKAAQQPPVVSHGYQESFEAAFDWQGTRDLAPWLTAPFAITFWDRYGGIDRVREHNHALVMAAQAMLLDRFGTEPLSPEDGSMLGSMATLPLPAAIAGHRELENPEDLNQLLAARFKVEVPVLGIGDQWHVRISAQVYNELDDYVRLADAIETLLGKGD